MSNTTKIIEAVQLIKEAKYLVAFTGAGISVESGIPPFRGENGIWSRYDPGILELRRYSDYPEETWPVINDLFYQYFSGAKPNEAHYFLASLEKQGLRKYLITQNIDNLHQEAGSSKVIEYHGNSKWLVCMECGERYSSEGIVLSSQVPRCPKDQAILKPDFIFFGEAIPDRAATRANVEAGKSDVFLLIGTTGEVMPASMVPRLAKNSGSKIIEINVEETVYTNSLTDIFLKGKAAEICTQLSEEFAFTN